MVALTSTQGIVIAGIGVALLIVGIALAASRGRRKVTSADIPSGMRPGPSDPDLETPLSGMFTRVRHVSYTTVISILGFLVLVLTRLEEAVKPHSCVFFALGLAVVGCLTAIQVRRIRAFSRYYVGDRGQEYQGTTA